VAITLYRDGEAPGEMQKAEGKMQKEEFRPAVLSA
jgi:hypothetical protein